jgi:hypothetical protein
MNWHSTVMSIALLAAAVVCVITGHNGAGFAFTLGSMFVWDGSA